MATFVWMPTAGTLSHEPFKIAGNYPNDGYRRVWTLEFQNRSEATAAAIEDFIKLNKPLFDWTPPTGGAGQWMCELSDLSFEVVPPGRRSVSAVFKEWW